MSVTRDVKTYVRQLLDQIRIFLAHILRIPTEHIDAPIVQHMHLCSFAVVLILARKPFTLESVEDLADRFGRLCEHRFEWDTRGKFACLREAVESVREEGWDNFIIVREFTNVESDIIQDVTLRGEGWRNITCRPI